MRNVVVGIGLLALAAFMLLGFFRAETTLTLPVTVLTLLVTVGVPSGVGGVLVWKRYADRGRVAGRREALRRQTLQAEVLRLAQQTGGKLTVIEVTAETGLGALEAEEILKSLVYDGVADIEITDSGLLVYSVGDVQRLTDKDSSRGVLDA